MYRSFLIAQRHPVTLLGRATLVRLLALYHVDCQPRRRVRALAVPAIIFTIKSISAPAFSCSRKHGLTSPVFNRGLGKHLYSLRPATCATSSKPSTSPKPLHARPLPYKTRHARLLLSHLHTPAEIPILCLRDDLAVSPVGYFWDRSMTGGTCLDVNKLAYAK